jgi:4-amino-4-deoxy-L-arabinose transferase-like glycosyltransferase
MLLRVQKRYSGSALLLVGIFLLGLVLRLGWIDANGYWTDEVSSIETVQNGLPFVFANHFGWVGNQTSWYYAFFWLLVQPIDPAISPVLVRLPSVLAGAFLPLVTYGLGRELFSRTAGLVAALMAALSPILLDQSHDGRPYSMFAFLTATSVFCLVMAQRTGKRGWWLGFMVVTVANLLNSYLAVTLVLPALAPYLAWALWRAWTERRRAGRERNFLYLTLSLFVVGVVGGLMLMEYMRMPSAPIAWGKLYAASFIGIPTNVMTSFTDLGIGGPLATLVSLGLLSVAGLGVCVAIREHRGRGLAICVPLCLLPSFVLAVIATSNLVFPRYVLFVGPFYFLLIGNAVAAALQVRPSAEEARPLSRFLRPGGVVLASLIAILYGLGALNYLNPSTHHNLSYRPDFRGVARYLSDEATPQDTIILADYPAHAYSVTNFYWNHHPPAHLYDARDPRLFSQQLEGNVYWVLSLLDYPLMDELAAPGQDWLDAVNLEGVVVLKENASGRKAADVVEGMAKKLDTLRPGYTPTRILWGSVFQARGDVARATEMYRTAVTGFWTGDLYLRTAQGFDATGLTADAWREGIISKAMEPYRPEVHIWLAQHLQKDGYIAESLLEGKIAEALRLDMSAASR